MTESFNPLNDKVKEHVVRGLQVCKDADEYLGHLEDIGIDTTERREKLAGFQHLFTTVAQKWHPGALE